MGDDIYVVAAPPETDPIKFLRVHRSKWYPFNRAELNGVYGVNSFPNPEVRSIHVRTKRPFR